MIVPEWECVFLLRPQAALMKKNILPLVIIAMVVAVISTGIFYGLIVSRMDGSPKVSSTLRYVTTKDLEKGHVIRVDDFRLTAAPDPGAPAPNKPEDLIGRTTKGAINANAVLTEHLLSPFAQRGLPSGIPDGMRAVTVHISDSSSVVQLLHPGDRVDVQALIHRNRNGETDLELRTLLQNATVFNITAAESNGNLQAKAVLTVLSSPQDAERLSVADAGAHLRIVLRNSADQRVQASGAISLLNLGAGPKPVVTSSFVPAQPVAKAVELELSLLEVTADQLSSYAPGAGSEVLSVLVGETRKAGKSTLLATSRLLADRSGEFSWKAPDLSTVRVRIEQLGAPKDGGVSLRIQPESSSANSGATSTRRVESNVQLRSTQTAVISGLLPGRKGADGELMLLITPVGAK